TGVAMTFISAGTSNTLLLTHKTLKPAHYMPGGQVNQDKGYAWTPVSTAGTGGTGANYDHMRWAGANGGGSSHAKGYAQDDENAVFQALWAYNRSIVVATP